MSQAPTPKKGISALTSGASAKSDPGFWSGTPGASTTAAKLHGVDPTKRAGLRFHVPAHWLQGECKSGIDKRNPKDVFAHAPLAKPVPSGLTIADSERPNAH